MTVATTYGDISRDTAIYVEQTALRTIDPVMVLDKFAKSYSIPAKSSNKITFRRPLPFPPVLNQLQEGVTPPARKFGYERIETQLRQYGDLVEISDRVQDFSEDPVLNEAVDEMTKTIAETRERLLWAVVNSGTNVSYSGTGTPTSRTDVNAPITLALQRAIVRSLKNQRATPITKMLSASPNFATEPVQRSFVAVAHSDTETDIRGLAGFLPVENYGGSPVLHDYELGHKENVRYITSPVLEPIIGAGSGTLNGMVNDGSNVNVYPIVYIAEDAYAHVAMKGPGSIKPTVINPETISKSDPLGQRGYVSWKMYFAALILNEAWIHRAEVGATEL